MNLKALNISHLIVAGHSPSPHRTRVQGSFLCLPPTPTGTGPREQLDSEATCPFIAPLEIPDTVPIQSPGVGITADTVPPH